MTEQELDRALAEALEIEPSPDFVARVRARVATEPAPMRWNAWWPVAAAGVAIAALVVGGVLRSEDGAAPQSVAAGVVASIEEPAASSVPPPSTRVEQAQVDTRGSQVTETRAVASPPSRRAFPEVLISPEDAGAVTLLLAGTRDSVVPAATDDSAGVPLTVTRIDLPLIDVEPLAALTQLNPGELQ